MKQHDSHEHVGRVLAHYFRKVRLARATELAISRRYLEALQLISPKGRLPETIDEIDLAARIAVQQRKYQEAEALWNHASKLFPETEAHRISAAHVARLRCNQLQIKQTAIAVIIALALSGLILALIYGFAGASQTKEPSTVSEKSVNIGAKKP